MTTSGSTSVRGFPDISRGLYLSDNPAIYGDETPFAEARGVQRDPYHFLSNARSTG